MVQLPSLHLWPLSSFNQIPLNPKGTSFDISFSGPVFYFRFYHTLYPFYASSLEPSTCFIIISRRPQNLGFSSHPAPLLLIRTSLQVLALQRESNSIDVRQQRTAFPPNFVHSLDGFTHDDDDSSCLQGRWPTFCRGA